MNPNDLPAAVADADVDTNLLAPLLKLAHAPDESGLRQGVVVGELLAIADDGKTPIVRCSGPSGGAAVRARSTVDLQGRHVGAHLVLMFDEGDPVKPIIIGVLRESAGWPQADPPAQMRVDADGKRLIVDAGEQLVLRCGKASITLTKAGKVLIEGTYLLSRSTGANRIKGGSVQLN